MCWSKSLRVSQARCWHEPRAIHALHTDVAALKTPHRRSNKADRNRRIGAMPAKRKRLKPDLDNGEVICDFDPLHHPRPPTAFTKADKPHPNGRCKFQLLNLGWCHRLSE